MEIIQIVGIGIVSAVLAILVKRLGMEMGVLVSIVGGVLIFFLVLPYLMDVLTVLNQLSESIDTNLDYIPIIFRILGVAYIAEFGAQICKDAGEGAIASKIEMGGKVIIMVLSAPIIISFLNLVITLLP